MLPWALAVWVFATFAALACVFTSGERARVLFYSLLVLFSTTLVYGLLTGHPSPAAITVRSP